MGSEVICQVVLSEKALRETPVHLHIAPVPIPSSRWLANDAYPQPAEVAKALMHWGVVTDEAIKSQVLSEIGVNADVPSESFKGPF